MAVIFTETDLIALAEYQHLSIDECKTVNNIKPAKLSSGLSAYVMAIEPNSDCKFLTPEIKCSIQEVKPGACRLYYGAVLGFSTCLGLGHGPELSQAEQDQIITNYHKFFKTDL